MKCTILNSTVKLTDLPHTVRFLWKKPVFILQRQGYLVTAPAVT